MLEPEGTHALIVFLGLGLPSLAVVNLFLSYSNISSQRILKSKQLDSNKWQ